MAPREDPSWLADSSCGRHPDVDFFPSNGDSFREAMEVCFGCTVRLVCLEHALSQHEFGIWGGTTERGRALIRRTRLVRRDAPARLEALRTQSPTARPRRRDATTGEEAPGELKSVQG
jgi:WhiB family transcriptional regulator, redox-sensing transcriptional regulator